MKYKCTSCNEESEYMVLWDDPDKGYAFNIYFCFYCGMIIKEDVWENKGILTIDIKNNINDGNMCNERITSK